MTQTAWERYMAGTDGVKAIAADMGMKPHMVTTRIEKEHMKRMGAAWNLCRAVHGGGPPNPPHIRILATPSAFRRYYMHSRSRISALDLQQKAIDRAVRFYHRNESSVSDVVEWLVNAKRDAGCNFPDHVVQLTVSLPGEIVMSHSIGGNVVWKDEVSEYQNYGSIVRMLQIHHEIAEEGY